MSTSSVKPASKTNAASHFKYVIVGGGIAGVSAVEQLRIVDENGSILMITQCGVVQATSKVNRVTQRLHDFVVVEKSFELFKDVDTMLTLVHDSVVELNWEEHKVMTESGQCYKYDQLCICTGALSKLINFEHDDGYNFNNHILGIRDKASITKVSNTLSGAKRILVVGNGGIATEFVYEVENVEIIWSIKDSSITSHYFDNGAACFLLTSKQYKARFVSGGAGSTEQDTERGPTVSKRLRYSTSSVEDFMVKENVTHDFTGSALGPDWHNDFILKGLAGGKTMDIQYETEIKRLFEPNRHYHLICQEFGELEANEAKNWKTYVELTNGKRFGVDWILSATGVIPNAVWFPGYKVDDLGISVNDWMHTSLPDVYAAGDVCYPCWPREKCWFQMRLWSQARTMGMCAGRSMGYATSNLDECSVSRTPSIAELETHESPPENRDLLFSGYDVFTHVTKFFGFKVVLLGLFNGQGIPKEDQRYEFRCTVDEEYVKVVIENDRVRGAVLIGDTGLEEAMENLILTQLDISVLGEVDILDPEIDLEDYFD